MSDTSMFFNIFGRDMGVGTMFEEVAGKGKGVTGALTGIGAAAAGLGIVKAGKDAVDTFEQTAQSAWLLQRQTGATAEDSSRLGFALSQMGLTAEDTSKGIGIFSKGLEAGTTSTTKHAAMVEKLGFEYLDANGKILPLTEILPRLASKFEGMEDGPEKTALALQLFGKSGQQMVPFLNQGGDAITDLMHKSDELGNTLTQDQVGAFREAQQANREWDAEMRGLMITIGSALLPVMHSMEEFIRGILGPALQGLSGWFKDLPGPVQGVITILLGIVLVGGPLVVMIGSMIGGITAMIPVVAGVGGALSALWVILMANPIFIVIGIIAAFVASLVFAYNNVGWFRDFVDGAFHLIQDIVSNVINFITGVLVPALVAGWLLAGQMAQQAGSFISDAWTNVSSTISGIVSAIIGFFQNLGSTAQNIWNGMVSGVQNAVGQVGSFFSSLPGTILGALGNLGGLLVNIGSQLIGGLISGIQGALGGLGDVLGAVGSFIASHKGPEEYDRQLLVPHGGWIMSGLMEGIKGSMPLLAGTLAGVADMVSGSRLGVNIDGSMSNGSNATIRGNTPPAPLQQASQQLPPVYVQNPFTGEYLLGKVDQRAGQAIDDVNDDIYRGRAR